jgi:hypothetical protein
MQSENTEKAAEAYRNKMRVVSSESRVSQGQVKDRAGEA